MLSLQSLPEEALFREVEDRFGLSIQRSEPVNGGWMNRKWKLETTSGAFLLKQYSHERYRQESQLEAIESALQKQRILWEKGVPCPELMVNRGRALCRPDDGTTYTMMRFAEGRHEGPETAAAAQLVSLGRACAQIHSGLASLPPDGKGYAFAPEALLSALQQNYETSVSILAREAPPEYRRCVLLQKKILSTLSPAFLNSLSKGFAHEDFASDNILFSPEGVTAVLDFDRCQYGFYLHDIGRALLSFAWNREGLQKERLLAFAEGYSPLRRLTSRELCDALRLCWILETPWWIQPTVYASKNPKLIRFREEIEFLTENWFDLDGLLPVLS